MSQDPGRPSWMEGGSTDKATTTGSQQQTQSYVKSDVSRFSPQSSSGGDSGPVGLTVVGGILVVIGIAWVIIKGTGSLTFYSDGSTETWTNWPAFICVAIGGLILFIAQKMDD